MGEATVEGLIKNYRGQQYFQAAMFTDTEECQKERAARVTSAHRFGYLCASTSIGLGFEYPL